ncbi:MAG TPA: hypothetical protein VF278_00115 [Pirellulales bacterium]
MTNDTTPRMIEGKHALLAVLAIGVVGAGAGWWYQHGLQRRPLALWGGNAARLILYAPEVAFCELEQSPGESSSNSVVIAGEPYFEHGCQDVARRPGFIHLRNSLLHDYSFDWSDTAAGARRWRSMLRFRQDDQTATLVFTDDFQYVMLVETGATACLRPIASGLRDVLRPTK